MGPVAPLTETRAFPDIDPDALALLRRLHAGGFQGLLVGGCVRDLLLHQRAKDFDIATDARADQIADLFPESRLLPGRGSVLAHVHLGGKVFDVATLRPLRTPAHTPLLSPETDLRAFARTVEVGTAAQDAASRDFSVNALYYDVVAGQVLDFVGGLADARARVLRSLGEPALRFRDDPSLVFRALRIAARRALTLEPSTLAGLREGIDSLPHCPFPLRAHELLESLDGGAAASCLRQFRELGVLDAAMPPLSFLLEGLGPPAWNSLLAFAEAMDRRYARGQKLSPPARLACVLLPLLNHMPQPPPPEAGAPAEPGMPGGMLSMMLAGLDPEGRLPLVKQGMALLEAQPVLRAGPGAPSASTLRSAPFFTEALDVFDVTLEATGGPRALRDGWSAPPTPGERSA
jgi:poly(A) polymerase